MRIAIIGSRTLTIENFDDYLPEGVTEIISGDALGIDTCAEQYADSHGIKFTSFPPNYKRFGRAAPILRNQRIVDYADRVFAFWDGQSRGTKNVIDTCIKKNKPIEIFRLDP